MQCVSCFVFTAPPSTEIYTLSLHALFRSVRIVVDVELGDGDLLAELAGNLLERRRDHPARTAPFRPEIDQNRLGGDRKSTRLNSSHVEISYAVFCLKKKNTS